ncbi:MAG TPA: amidohydrolase family protein, partial [Phycicoccus sp.]|nr:amidohydrolase family protein [Phycicoccus sp.]
MSDLVIRSRRAIIDGAERPATITVSDGLIRDIGPLDAPLPDGVERSDVLDLGPDVVLIPGLVDTHVHVNEPGRTEWEGFESATRAAAAGGVTTLIDMPLNSIPPTTTSEGLRVKRSAATTQSFVDVGFWGGAVPGNVADLAPLHEAGVFGFKCFLLHSGVDEFPPLSPVELREALTEAARIDALVIVHAEDAATIEAATPASGRLHQDFVASRPRDAEERAIAEVIAAARETGARVHILHLSDGDALPMLRQAQADGVRISVETCPH